MRQVVATELKRSPALLALDLTEVNRQTATRKRQNGGTGSAAAGPVSTPPDYPAAQRFWCAERPPLGLQRARTVAHPGHLATPRAAVPPPPAPHRRPAYQTGPTAPCAAFSAVRAGSGVHRGLVESRFGPTNPPCTVVQTFPAVSVWSTASSDPRAGACLMTAGADRALEVTSGTESFAAGVPVVGRHQLDGHAKIGSR